MNFALCPLLLDFVFDIVNALSQNFLQEILLLDLLTTESLDLSQGLFL